MSNEFYIAKRLSSRKHGERAGIMERVATIATAISLTVIIITLSVVVGFKQSVDDLLRGASADIVVTAPQSMGTLSPVLLERNENLTAVLDRGEVVRCSPYLAKEGVIKSDENIVGVVLKGVDSLYNLRFFEQYLVEGELPRIGREPRSRDVMLSADVAQKMDIGVGERIEMLFVDTDDGLLRDRFVVSGLFKTGLDMIDNTLVISDIRNVERFYADGKSAVTGYELWLDEGVDVEMYSDVLNTDFMNLYF
jgi:lipoprotein-releasing system permease protein